MLKDVVGGIVEKVVEDHIFKLKSLALIDREAESMLEDAWYMLLGFLVPHQDDLVTPKLRLAILGCEKASLGGDG